MSLSADAVVLILQSRLDYLSARTVLKQAATEAGLNPGGPFQGADVEKLATRLLASGPRMAGVVEALRKAGGGAKAAVQAPPAPEPVAAPEPPPAEAQSADAKAPEADEEAEAGDAGEGKARPKAKPGGKKG